MSLPFSDKQHETFNEISFDGVGSIIWIDHHDWLGFHGDESLQIWRSSGCLIRKQRITRILWDHADALWAPQSHAREQFCPSRRVAMNIRPAASAV